MNCQRLPILLSVFIRMRDCRMHLVSMTKRQNIWRRSLREFAEEGFINIVGGCCGTTPAHITSDCQNR